MTGLSESLAAFETELSAAGHPLADSARRPLGVPLDVLQARAVELLGHELPSELAEYWGWCGGLLGMTVSYPEGVEALGYSDNLLPGRIRAYDLQQAARETLDHNENDVANGRSHSIAGFETWLRIAEIESSWIFCAEIPAGGGGGVTPVSVHDMYEYEYDEPAWRFTSIAEFVDFQAMLVRDGYYTKESGYWDIVHGNELPSIMREW